MIAYHSNYQSRLSIVDPGNWDSADDDVPLLDTGSPMCTLEADLRSFLDLFGLMCWLG